MTYLKQQSIENMVPTVPLMIVQGSKDHLVDPRGTYAYYQQLCKSKSQLFIKQLMVEIIAMHCVRVVLLPPTFKYYRKIRLNLIALILNK